MRWWHRYFVIFLLPGVLAVALFSKFALRFATSLPRFYGVAAAIAAAFLIFSVAWVRLFERLWRGPLRSARGQCIKCGYSLTGNLSSVGPDFGTLSFQNP